MGSADEKYLKEQNSLRQKFMTLNGFSQSTTENTLKKTEVKNYDGSLRQSQTSEVHPDLFKFRGSTHDKSLRISDKAFLVL